ncbi:MAG: PQQ-dependent dehydrogenase, methanol/ethanol family [Alphaproteobacteria bacterium]|nr:PQQ-dependent dehydrogenase, methanol/ethanol family [Alphaproteobacteria bacterium]
MIAWIVGAIVVLVLAVPLVGPSLLASEAVTAGTNIPATESAALAATSESQTEEAAATGEAPTAAELRREDQRRMRAAARIDERRVAAADTPEEQGNWLQYGRTYSEQRFSPLTGITRENVKQLGVAWEFETGTTRGLEATPIVADGIMYATGNWGVVWALDAKDGRLLWTYDPEVPGEWGRKPCCDIVNRGVAVWKGAVYVATLDGRLVKLDADTGNPIWDINTIDRSRAYSITGAPRIVKDMVIIGNGGAELGVRGYITAYDTKTGRQLWRFYTVPGDPQLPQEGDHLKAALETWPTGPDAPEWWVWGGGGTVWDNMSYDPDLNLLYIGVGNGSPWSRMVRTKGQGANLFISSIVAINPDTGAYVWHYQTTPADTWDYTATQHMILADLKIDGRTRKVIMQAPKNGFFYVLDRETGELISAEKYAVANWADRIDLETGLPVENQEVLWLDKPGTVVWPSQGGAHNWQPMAYSPPDGLVYIPVIDLPAIWVAEKDFTYRHNLWNTGDDFAAVSDALEAAIASGEAAVPMGYVRAWDPVTQKERWSFELDGPWNGGLLATASGLVFGGDGGGTFRAFKSDTGEVLWSIDLKTGIIAPPVTYLVDGEQYVSLLAGWGGAFGLANTADPRTAVIKHGSNAGRLFTFKIGGRQEVELVAAAREPIAEPPAQTATPAVIEAGSKIYAQNCLFCHGYFAESAGVLPDLRKSAPDIWDQYQEIVIGGALSAGGMASFADHLSPADVDAVRAYVLAQAHKYYERTQAEAPATP